MQNAEPWFKVFSLKLFKCLNLSHLSPKKRLSLLAFLAVGLIALFIFIQLKGNLSYILIRRSYIILTMILVAFAASVGTLLFQTITNNRILTPTIMGFEMLFVLIQTLIVALSIDFNQTDFKGFLILKFIIETGLLALFACLLFRWLFFARQFNLTIVIMIGIVIGTLFRGMASLIQRMLDPNDFSILQNRLFATFTRAEPVLIWFSLGLAACIALILWRYRFSFDVLALGKSNAINLGINYQKMVMHLLLLISILIAISTALVGPLTFLGLIAAHLTYHLAGSSQHRYLLPFSFLIALIALVGGQLILQYGLNQVGVLSVVIELVGGLFFIYLMLKRSSK